MDLFSAIETRTSCRQFLPDPVEKSTVERILAAGIRAPSPLNTQPWRFIVITDPKIKQAIHTEAERCRTWAMETSGWKWLGKYRTDFLLQAPVLVAVVGNPEKSGMDMFQEDGPVGYLLACAAAVQNMLLAAHALGLGSLFFTLFDKGRLRSILDIPENRTPVALVCIGKSEGTDKPVPRKAVDDKTVYLDA
ncbi:nitroreductase [Desulfosarcina widdelii]|uniref:Nitroreductase n=1 Tax=Desulfosarcina widdelii TaxID=947919 RepID=A0A5K7ZAT6_9BACT|nr:nitroreductase family protein [Desulfosarcina widdelii]BBO73507.1 nitroreductase [Desulfosarcina widdelii]